MKDLRLKINTGERKDLRRTMVVMRKYLLTLLKERAGNRCERCGERCECYDIHERIYNPKIALKHLQLLCEPCHKSISDFKRINNKTPYFAAATSQHSI